MKTHFLVWFGRIALFIVYFWFGFLKLIDSSPANPLVQGLLERTLPFISFNHFIVVLGVVEMLIAVLFLIPRLNKVALGLLVVHMITTLGPLVLLPAVTWTGFMKPSLEGQYIIKNVIILALALFLVGNREVTQNPQSL